MHSQLLTISHEFQAASDRLLKLRLRVPDDRWSERHHQNQWSVGECVEHLNLTGRAYLPRLSDGLARARILGGGASARYRRDLTGWFLWRILNPPVRLRLPTTPAFIPGAVGRPEELVAEFQRLQVLQLECLAAADQLPIDRVRITSPFNAKMGYNLFAAFSQLPRHQHRHLWQAEQVWAESSPVSA